MQGLHAWVALCWLRDRLSVCLGTPVSHGVCFDCGEHMRSRLLALFITAAMHSQGPPSATYLSTPSRICRCLQATTHDARGQHTLSQLQKLFPNPNPNPNNPETRMCATEVRAGRGRDNTSTAAGMHKQQRNKRDLVQQACTHISHTQPMKATKSVCRLQHNPI